MRQWIATALVVSLLGVSMQAQTNQEEKRLSPGLAVTGGAMIVIGVAMLLPHGDQYNVLGDTYCVSQVSVERGGCGPDYLQLKIALTSISVGTLFAFIGTRHVKVAPTQKGIGASVSLRW